MCLEIDYVSLLSTVFFGLFQGSIVVFISVPGVERLLERALHGHLPVDRRPPTEPCDHPRAWLGACEALESCPRHVAILDPLLPGECLRTPAKARNDGQHRTTSHSIP